jgi:flavin reductase (DIM6/NTAB) family NADH-FMN oxidoreductase RutF
MSRRSTETSFHTLAAELDYSMLIVTARGADGERAGCLVGFATQTSIRPPRFLVCLSRKNRTYRVARDGARTLVVHFVPREAEALAQLFGGETGDEVDKFARCDWHPGPDGIPVIDALDTWFAGSVLEQLDLGDHVGFLLDPVEGEAHRGQRPFTFHRARRIEAGHPA